MAGRLRRLEGMVRGMMDEEGGANKKQPGPGDADETAAPQGAVTAAEAAAEPPSAEGGQVVQANGARGGSTTYVGATHFMAMLDDVRAGTPAVSHLLTELHTGQSC